MKILYWSVAAPLMVLAVLFAISNMGTVELGLWPLPWTGAAPVYLVAFGAFTIGFFAGGFVAWLGAGKTRRRARQAERLAAEEEREIAALRRKLDDAEQAVDRQDAAGNDPGADDGAAAEQRPLIAAPTR